MLSVFVAALFVYPVKGCRATFSSSAVVEARGLRFDRRWMFVHEGSGSFLSQREHPELARLVITVADSGDLDATWDDDSLTVPHIADAELPSAPATIWSYTGDALDCGDDAARFFSDKLRFPVRLVRVPNDWNRRVKPGFAVSDNDGTGFADGFPVLLTSTASLADLNGRLGANNAVPMNRFRPNIVVAGDGLAAWSEDGWRTVRIGDAVFHNVKPCDRCAVTTIDQTTGTRTGAEPLATLTRFRRDPVTGKVLFGANLTPDAALAPGSVIKVGDAVRGSNDPRNPWA